MKRSVLGRAAAATAVFVLSVSATFTFGSPSSVSAVTVLPGGFTDTAWVSGLFRPYQMEFAPDGRLFVSQQGGALRVIKNGVLLPTPFATLTVDPPASAGCSASPSTRRSPRTGSSTSTTRATSPGPQPRQPVHRRRRRRGRRAARSCSSSSTNLERRHQPQRRRDPLRPRRQAVRRRRRERQPRQLPDADQPASARCCGSTPTAPSRPTIRSSTPPRGRTGRSGRWACATRSPSRSSRARAGSSSTTWAQSTWEEINDGIAGRQLRVADHGGPHHRSRAIDSPLFAYGHGAGATLGCAIAGGAFYNPATPQFPARTSATTSSRTRQRLDPAARPGHGRRDLSPGVSAGGPQGRPGRQPLLPARGSTR